MKVLLLNGSPHEKGCTHTALTEIASTLERHDIQSEIFWIGNDPIAGCIGCGACGATGRCFRQDGVNDFVERAREADGFIFGSPVHYASASGAIASFLDRVFMCGGRQGVFVRKPAASIVSARRAGTTATLDQLNRYIAFHHMPMVPSLYWNMVYGSNPDEVRRDEEGMQIMRMLGENMAWMMRAFALAREAGIEEPQYEPKIKTPKNR